MPHAKKLQGWVTIRGPDSGTVVQDDDEWLDLWDYDDIVIWYQFGEVSNIDSFDIQTSPVRDGDMFVQLAGLSLATTSVPRVAIATFAGATNPLARYLRWKCTGRAGGTFSFSFRAWIVASGRALAPRMFSFTPSASEDIEDEDDILEDEDGAPDDGDVEETAQASEEEDERARNAWHPPIIFAGPNTLRVPGLGPPTVDLATALAPRRPPKE